MGQLRVEERRRIGEVVSVTEMKLPEKLPVLRVASMPADVNQNGDIFGGWVMSLVDIAGGIVAQLRAHGRVVTVAVNSLTFKHPVLVGDLVSFFADVAGVGTTSLTVNVEVYTQRHPEKVLTLKVTEACITYVAIDETGRPRPVPVAAPEPAPLTS
jgi:acyl-CoA thioesterase YciA